MSPLRCQRRELTGDVDGSESDTVKEVTIDVLCDICHQATDLEFGTLNAHWGYKSKHDGERYEVQLCESCFFNVLSTLRTAKRDHHMFNPSFNINELDSLGLK